MLRRALGRLFHSRGPQVLKALSPSDFLHFGTINLVVSDVDLRDLPCFYKATSNMGKCIFNTAWLEKPKYRVWLRTDSNKRKARCRLCAKTFDIGAMGPQLEKLMEQLRSDMQTNPPLPGSYTPKKGDVCAAKFSQDSEWYRAKVEKISGSNVSVLYIDYGNREKTTSSQLAVLPATFHGLPAHATLHGLACVTLPPDEESKQEAIDALYNDIINKQCLMNNEYTNNNVLYVSLVYPESQTDVANGLVADGLVLVEARREKRLSKLVSTYIKSQEKAKSERKNVWRYGDFTQDDAKEFGYQG